MNLDHFVHECIDANRERDAQAAVLEVLVNAVSEPRQMLAAVGEPQPQHAGIAIIHRSEMSNIVSAACTPQVHLMPNNHLMWANIGI